MEADKAVEWERQQDLARQEELRTQQSQQLEALRMKAVKQQERATAKVEIKQYSSTAMRPGDFGYGNVTTGQVASRKYEILTRASSVGLSEREGLNPDLLSHSARSSPAPPLFPVAVPPGTMQMKATGEAEMSVQQRSQQTSTALKADFAESTVSRRQQQQSSTVSKMTSSTMESSSSTQQMSMSSSQFSASS